MLASFSNCFGEKLFSHFFNRSSFCHWNLTDEGDRKSFHPKKKSLIFAHSTSYFPHLFRCTLIELAGFLSFQMHFSEMMENRNKIRCCLCTKSCSLGPTFVCFGSLPPISQKITLPPNTVMQCVVGMIAEMPNQRTGYIILQVLVTRLPVQYVYLFSFVGVELSLLNSKLTLIWLWLHSVKLSFAVCYHMFLPSVGPPNWLAEEF